MSERAPTPHGREHGVWKWVVAVAAVFAVFALAVVVGRSLIDWFFDWITANDYRGDY